MPKTDTLLAQCTIRAQRVVYGDKPGFRDMGKTMALAGRVVAFVCTWALARQELGRDLTVGEYIEWCGEPPRTPYRRLAEFRDLWPEYGTPNELAALLLAHSARGNPTPGTQIPVVA